MVRVIDRSVLIDSVAGTSELMIGGVYQLVPMAMSQGAWLDHVQLIGCPVAAVAHVVLLAHLSAFTVGHTCAARHSAGSRLVGLNEHGIPLKTMVALFFLLLDGRVAMSA